MDSKFLSLASEVWIKTDRMVVNLKSLERGSTDERCSHEGYGHMRKYKKHRQEMWEVKSQSDLTVQEYYCRFGRSKTNVLDLYNIA